MRTRRVPRIYIGSIKKVATLDRFTAAFPGPYLLSAKIDGYAIAITATRIYTRAHTYWAHRDISFLRQYIDIPHVPRGTIVKAELISPVVPGYTRAKNFVGAALASQRPALLSKLAVVAHGILQPRYRFDDQYARLKRMGFHVPAHTVVRKVDIATLRRFFAAHQNGWQLDGVVVADLSRVHRPTGKQKEDYIVAFKDFRLQN
jgi:hypothetical protein